MTGKFLIDCRFSSNAAIKLLAAYVFSGESEGFPRMQKNASGALSNWVELFIGADLTK